MARRHPAVRSRPTSAPEDRSFDGRVRRGVHSHERIVAAIYELVRGGELEPTVDRIADVAGVGQRTVFRHFYDLEQLRAAMGARVQREVLELAQPPPPGDGPLASRVAALVRHRVRIYEHLAPFRRAAIREQHRSLLLQKHSADLAATLRLDLERVFAVELESAPESAHAVDAMTSFDVWERLRTTQKLGRRSATSVLELGVLRILAGDRPLRRKGSSSPRDQPKAKAVRS